MKEGIVKPEMERSVLMSGNVYLYNAKAPYAKSGMSIKGALEYDPEDDTVRCHECGKWFKHVGIHLRSHETNVKDHKSKHGLKMGSALCSEKVRLTRIIVAQKGLVPWSLNNKSFHRTQAKKIAKAKIGKAPRHSSHPVEVQNIKKQCPEQILRDLKLLRDRLGRTPSINEIVEDGKISLKTLRWTFGSINKARELAELQPFSKGKSKEQVIASLKNFIARYGRRPTYSDQRRGLIPTQPVYARLFSGGWGEALVEAGSVRPNNTVRLSKKEMLLKLKQVCDKIGRVPTANEHIYAQYGIPSQPTYTRVFGSWKKALAKIGLKPNSKAFRIQKECA